jgi:hypothetical protein
MEAWAVRSADQIVTERRWPRSAGCTANCAGVSIKGGRKATERRGLPTQGPREEPLLERADGAEQDQAQSALNVDAERAVGLLDRPIAATAELVLENYAAASGA